MTESWMVAIALPIAVFITYLTYKYNLLGDGKGKVGIRQQDTELEKYFIKILIKLRKKQNIDSVAQGDTS